MKATRGTLCLLVILMASSWSTATVFTRDYVLDVPAPTSNAQILNGLSAHALFTWDDANPTVLMIDLTNTSTGVPNGFTNAAQLLTAISFDFGHPGYNGDAMIVGGTVTLAADGTSYDMDVPVSGGADLTGEWGYGNVDGTGLLTNIVTATASQTTPFGGANLDGPVGIDGPQAGISTIPPLVPTGGLGAVADSVIITLQLDAPLTDLNFLDENGVMAEFGSDAAYLVPTPEPAALTLMMIGTFALLRRKR